LVFHSEQVDNIYAATFMLQYLYTTINRPEGRHQIWRQQSQTAAATKRRKERAAKYWREELESIDVAFETVKSPNGKSRTFKENKIFVLAIGATLRRQRKAVIEGRMDPLKMSWTSIEKEVAKDFHVGCSYVTKIRCMFIEDGDVAMFGELEAHGGGAENNSLEKQQKVPGYVLVSMASYIDKVHAKGTSVTNRKLRNWLRDTHGIDVSRRTIQRKLCALGLSWSKIKPKKKTLNSYRLKAIRDFSIQHDLVYKSILSGGSDYVYVFTDESYMHQSYAMDHSYLPKDNKAIERKTGKGRRLIILHAITTDGPVCVTEENRRPIDDLVWKGDTCLPTPRADGKLSYETLWIAQSHTGGYHDNMNNNMFMLWVEEKLVPVFEQQYPRKKMVLVADNAPYHHKRVIGSLASVTKKKIVEMMVEHSVKYIDLPLRDKRMELVGDKAEDHRDCIRIHFDPEEQNKQTGARDPRIANGEELKVAFVNYLCDNKPEMLECKVEKCLHDRGYKVI
jgi:hypothetical protein